MRGEGRAGEVDQCSAQRCLHIPVSMSILPMYTSLACCTHALSSSLLSLSLYLSCSWYRTDHSPVVSVLLRS